MTLNLARVLRPKTFDQLVGQSINVRMIKNSLYRNYFFPVYLLTGQRGTGKTSLARILAAALNCDALSAFQKEPKLHPLPCLICTSCIAMSSEHHPDFIEMDGASQTGVDAIRTIIDAANFMPVLGSKKIYLIDEAHMLSKAAFNALLKMLEEPPVDVHFILATTEHTKVIDTVRSRSFQLFLNPIKQPTLTSYLKDLCLKENIIIDDDALIIIAQESHGSLRDAINMLEQARFAASSISAEIVCQILGHPSQKIIEQLLFLLLDPLVTKGIVYIKNSLNQEYTAITVWTLVARFFSVMLTNIDQPDQHSFLVEYMNFASLCTFTQSMHVIYEYEQKITKSSNGYGALQCMFLELHALVHTKSPLDTAPLKKKPNLPLQMSDITIKTDDETLKDKNHSVSWNGFLKAIELLKDPLLLSVFKQAIPSVFNDTIITLNFYKDMHFFKEIIDTSAGTWRPLLVENFASNADLALVFNKERSEPLEQPKRYSSTHQPPSHKPAVSYKKEYHPSTKKTVYQPLRIPLDISDATQWPKAHALQSLFGGVVYLE